MESQYVPQSEFFVAFFLSTRVLIFPMVFHSSYDLLPTSSIRRPLLVSADDDEWMLLFFLPSWPTIREVEFVGCFFMDFLLSLESFAGVVGIPSTRNGFHILRFFSWMIAKVGCQKNVAVSP